MHCHFWLSVPYYFMINTEWSTKNQTHDRFRSTSLTKKPSCCTVMMSWSNNKDEHFFFFMFNTGVTYCLREQLSWGRKAEPSTDSFTEEEAWLGSENKALSWLSEPKLQIWLWPWAGHLTCSENRKIKVKNLQVNKNVENSLPILLFLCTVRYSMV